jgi:hypothetical protein
VGGDELDAAIDAVRVTLTDEQRAEERYRADNYDAWNEFFRLRHERELAAFDGPPPPPAVRGLGLAQASGNIGFRRAGDLGIWCSGWGGDRSWLTQRILWVAALAGRSLARSGRSLAIEEI